MKMIVKTFVDLSKESVLYIEKSKLTKNISFELFK